MRVRLDFVAGKVLPGRVAHTPPAWAEQLRIAEEVVVRRDSQAIKQANNRFPRRTGEKTRHDLALPFTRMLRMFKEKAEHFTTRIRPARVCITPARTAACPCVRRAVNGP